MRIEIDKEADAAYIYVKELDRKPHLLRCGCSLSIQKTSAFSNLASSRISNP